MKFHTLDLRLIVGLLLAHILMFFSFQDKAIFWYIFSGSTLLLIAYSSFQGEVDDDIPFFRYIFLGIVTGIIFYLIIWGGFKVIQAFHWPLDNNVSRLYRYFAPSIFWQYLALILVAAPGEELFWRGFIQKRLLRYFQPFSSILLGSLLYASVQIYSGDILLIFVTFFAGLAWGGLYIWKKSMPMIIVSHIIFDILLFILNPLK